MWIDRQLTRFPWAGWCIGPACAIFFMIFLSLPRSDQAEVTADSQINLEQVATGLNAIGTGPLRLKGSGASPMLITLTSQLAMLGKSHRPESNNSSVLLGLTGSSKQRQVRVGESLYLKVDERTKAMEFSESPQEVILRPQAIDAESVTFDIEPCALFPRETLRIFTLKKQGSLQAPEGFPPVLALQDSLFWGPDLLIEQYGGEEFGRLKGHAKLELFEGKESYFLYVKEGELLTWKEGRWQQEEIAEKGDAFARVNVYSHQLIELEVWDETGFASRAVRLKPAWGPRPGAIQAVLTEVHRRSNSEVTAAFGKKRMILKEGDWVLNGKHGWRKIRSLHGIDACLSHDLRGELFIFDRIEGDQLIGNLFDEMRTTQTSIRIPLKRGNS